MQQIIDTDIFCSRPWLSFPTKWLKHFTECFVPRYSQVKDDEFFNRLDGLQATPWTSDILFICPNKVKNCQNHEQMMILSKFELLFHKSLVTVEIMYQGFSSSQLTQKEKIHTVTTRPTVATARDSDLKPVQHSLVFREYNISQRVSTGLLQPIYETISIYFFKEFWFVIACSRNQFGQKIAFCGRKLFDPASSKNARISF